jgi:small subunit ribosomal protein S6
LETLTKKKLYEGMFLIDSAQAAADWDGSIAVITKILEKADAEIVSVKKWDERKLAYPIKGQSRGTYILCYFKADGRKIHDVEKSVQLSEQIIRAMILNAEKMTAEDIEKETPAMKNDMDFESRDDDEDRGARTVKKRVSYKNTEDEEDAEIPEVDEPTDDTEQDWEDTFESEDSETEETEDDFSKE